MTFLVKETALHKKRCVCLFICLFVFVVLVWLVGWLVGWLVLSDSFI